MPQKKRVFSFAARSPIAAAIAGAPSWVGRAVGGALLFILALPGVAPAHGEAVKDVSCVPPARWMSPTTGNVIEETKLIGAMAQESVVLLGETHDNRDHHRWQLYTMAALYAVHPDMVIAFEAFPRRVQPVLDRWVHGDLSESAFLRRSEWNTVWRFDPSLYMPLFQFARMHRIPMVAMNVDRALIGAINRKGVGGVPPKDREGIGLPAPPAPQYRAILKTVFDQHDAAQHPKKTKSPPHAPAADHSGKNSRFDHFVAAQLTWDRAMAEAISRARHGAAKPLVIAIAGRGHLEYGYGIAHQLKALGVADVATLIPWDPNRPCAALKSHDRAIADAVFGLPSHPEDPHPDKPKLGVLIAPAPKGAPAGVKVEDVVAGSVGAVGGIHKGDIIVAAAGRPTKDVETLIATIRAQAPGTWLPLKVFRAGATMTIIAKFPAHPGGTADTPKPTGR
ncbi:ChaN family lipoprotein [Varunaivibrio sulfuroxidans]|uniref:Putative iron-regulated protein n=1 Tax=Varunaivibrio sulfuroxidans TaxID=1773489 RepID=A0A4R3J980_9PROT|nr:ChaN family lipoprotein [Varunaivibrio sulfuroxidans]TCS62509.1 putative iron-regulated protein [Varunaivibrio sulfuroxidans]WES30820.1 ChaN family lipoprotein [Varunaivibrio sulfuroxidans]